MGTDEGLPVLGVKTVARPKGGPATGGGRAPGLWGNAGSGADRPLEGARCP